MNDTELHSSGSDDRHLEFVLSVNVRNVFFVTQNLRGFNCERNQIYHGIKEGPG